MIFLLQANYQLWWNLYELFLLNHPGILLLGGPINAYSFSGEFIKSFKPPDRTINSIMINPDVLATTCYGDHEVLIIDRQQSDTLKLIPVEVIDALDLIDSIPQIEKNKNFKYSDSLIEQIKGLKPEDNQVIVLYKLIK